MPQRHSSIQTDIHFTSFEIFLEEDQEQFFFDFFYMAETRNELKIRGVKEELEKYGLVFIVDYQARKNNLNNSGSR